MRKSFRPELVILMIVSSFYCKNLLVREDEIVQAMSFAPLKHCSASHEFLFLWRHSSSHDFLEFEWLKSQNIFDHSSDRFSIISKLGGHFSQRPIGFLQLWRQWLFWAWKLLQAWDVRSSVCRSFYRFHQNSLMVWNQKLRLLFGIFITFKISVKIFPLLWSSMTTLLSASISLTNIICNPFKVWIHDLQSIFWSICDILKWGTYLVSYINK